MSDADDERGPSRRLWVLAAAAALALHFGGAALAVGYLKLADEDGLATNVTEFAVELESPKLPDENLPPGPDVEAAQASMPQAEQKAELKQADIPNEKPTTSGDADRVVSENASKKPREEEAKIAAVQTEASPEREDQLATARQQLDEKARDSEQMKAPNFGIGKDRLALKAKWDKIISVYFQRHLRYPEHRDKSATVKLAFVLNRRGNVVSVSVTESSGDPVFDDAAVSMVRRSDPVPAPPAELTDDQFSFKLPVKFTKPKK